MQLQTNNYLRNGVVTAEIVFPVLPSGVEPLTGAERDALLQSGSPVVDFGGSITDGVDLTFSLPARQLRVPDELPVRQSFTIADFPDAVERANAWLETCLSRIETAIEGIRADLVQDSTVGTKVVNIDTTPAP